MKQLKIVSYTNVKTGETKEKKSWVDMQFDDEQGYLFWNRKTSVKTFIDMPLPKELTWTEKGRIQELKYYIIRGDQLLAYRSNNVIKPLLVPQICKILKMSEKQCKLLMSKAKQYHIIKEIMYGTIKYYAFNPIYGFRGKRISLNTYIMFQEELKKVLPKWVIKKFAEQALELKPNITIVK